VPCDTVDFAIVEVPATNNVVPSPADESIAEEDGSVPCDQAAPVLLTSTSVEAVEEVITKNAPHLRTRDHDPDTGSDRAVQLIPSADV
jgi:hypothetical protein